MSFLERMQTAAAELEAAKPVDRWLLPLQRLHGKIGYNGIETICTQHVLDYLQVEQRDRRAGTYRHLCKVMVSLGWRPIRVRDVTRGGYKEQVRGYVRNTS